jgi:hypothetical protein
MTQEEALEAYKAMFPGREDKLAVELDRKIGYVRGFMDIYYLLDYSGDCIALAFSHISWEDALSKLGDK